MLNFANIKHDLKQYNVRYKTKIERDLPSDEEIVRIVESVPEAWRWTFGILATYGLRGHEIKLLDCSKTEDPPHIVYVHSDTKSGSRPVYPVPPQWVNRWRLWEVNKPNIAIGQEKKVSVTVRLDPKIVDWLKEKDNYSSCKYELLSREMEREIQKD